MTGICTVKVPRINWNKYGKFERPLKLPVYHFLRTGLLLYFHQYASSLLHFVFLGSFLRQVKDCATVLSDRLALRWVEGGKKKKTLHIT